MLRWQPCVGAILVFGALLVSAADPEVTAPTPWLIENQGYPAETHNITTEDEYILTVHRIPRPGAPAVLLQHGLEDASHTWVINMPYESLGFLLYDAGFDVWMGNSRGNRYSMGHHSLSPDSKEFWAFTFDELAKYDLPAVVNFITSFTNESKIGYVGHSQGTVMGFIGFCNETLASKISLFVALSPVAYVGHVDVPLLHALARFNLVELLLLLGEKSFLPSTAIISKLLPNYCKLAPSICEDGMCILMGCNKNNWNATRFDVYSGHDPAGTSVTNMAHFSQAVKNDNWQMFDFGSREANQRHYHSDTPPAYNLSKVLVDMALYTGGRDALADPTDVVRLTAELPLARIKFHHDEPDYSHLDPIWGLDAKDKIYPSIMQQLKDAASAQA